MRVSSPRKRVNSGAIYATLVIVSLACALASVGDAAPCGVGLSFYIWRTVILGGTALLLGSFVIIFTAPAWRKLLRRDFQVAPLQQGTVAAAPRRSTGAAAAPPGAPGVRSIRNSTALAPVGGADATPPPSPAAHAALRMDAGIVGGRSAEGSITDLSFAYHGAGSASVQFDVMRRRQSSSGSEAHSHSTWYFDSAHPEPRLVADDGSATPPPQPLSAAPTRLSSGNLHTHSGFIIRVLVTSTLANLVIIAVGLMLVTLGVNALQHAQAPPSLSVVGLERPYAQWTSTAMLITFWVCPPVSFLVLNEGRALPEAQLLWALVLAYASGEGGARPTRRAARRPRHASSRLQEAALTRRRRIERQTEARQRPAGAPIPAHDAAQLRFVTTQRLSTDVSKTIAAAAQGVIDEDDGGDGDAAAAATSSGPALTTASSSAGTGTVLLAAHDTVPPTPPPQQTDSVPMHA
jgi:hypothetical protein